MLVQTARKRKKKSDIYPLKVDRKVSVQTSMF